MKFKLLLPIMLIGFVSLTAFTTLDTKPEIEVNMNEPLNVQADQSFDFPLAEYVRKTDRLNIEKSTKKDQSKVVFPKSLNMNIQEHCEYTDANGVVTTVWSAFGAVALTSDFGSLSVTRSLDSFWGTGNAGAENYCQEMKMKHPSDYIELQ